MLSLRSDGPLHKCTFQSSFLLSLAVFYSGNLLTYEKIEGTQTLQLHIGHLRHHFEEFSAGGTNFVFRAKANCFSILRDLLHPKMTYTYSQRSLMVLALLGVLSAIMSLLSVFLIFQLQSQQTGVKESTSPIVPVEVAVVLLPVSTVLTALSLTLNLSSVVVCILHSYFTAEICRGEEDTERADWFLFDSRAVRHVAIGLFCLGVSVYLAAMSIYMLLVFENETGIASVCVLSSGVLILLIIVAHSLARAARTARQYHSEHPHAMYQNEPESSPGVYPPELGPRGQSQDPAQPVHPAAPAVLPSLP
ncbi:hypothetical protein AALO_G00128590 [Alosa alosa]|uniref:Transmembrane protein 221 n=1 Tax=Alosa alosa TaxID=278164 RepID=A0AAV6GMP8_9TELE|nr:hypothetical protein AALO_G00128590 [Alosa alosa]